MDDPMTEAMEAAAQANEHITTEYTPDETQYASPFACETGMPGNYFMHDDLTSPIKEAATRQPRLRAAKVGRQIAEIAIMEAEDVTAVDETDMTDRMWHGVHEMIWHRWGKGGFAEGLTVRELGGEHPNPEKVAQEKFGCSAAQADTNHGIDIIDKDGETHQVKAKDSEHKPKPKDKKKAEHLWWLNTETGNLKKID